MSSILTDTEKSSPNNDNEITSYSCSTIPHKVSQLSLNGYVMSSLSSVYILKQLLKDVGASSYLLLLLFFVPPFTLLSTKRWHLRQM